MRGLPAIGLGCAALGMGDVPEAVAQATLEAALAEGIDYFDTSPLYGGGLSEKRLGQALAGQRERVFVSTKVGYRIDFPEGGRQPPAERVQDFSPAFVRQSIEASLTRLGLDRIDLVYLHDAPDAERAGCAVETLRELQVAGTIGGIGLGTTDCARAIAMIERYQLDAVLIAGRHTLLDRSAEEALLPIAAAHGVAVVAGGVFNSGILADPSSGRFDYAPADDEIVNRVRRLSEAAAGFGTSLTAAALHFVTGDSRIASTLLGAASPDELKECLALLRAPMPAIALQEIAAAR